MDAYELGRAAIKQANSTEGWGASLGGAAGGTMGGSIGGAIGKFTGGLADKAVGAAKNWATGGGKPSTPTLNMAGTSAMTKADPFSTTFGQLLGKTTGTPGQAMMGLQQSGNLRGGMNHNYGRPPSLDDLAGTRQQPQFGGAMAGPQPNFSFQPQQAMPSAGAATPQQPGFLSGVWSGLSGDQSQPAGLANTAGRLLGGEFDPLSPFRGGMAGIAGTLGTHAALAGAPMYGSGPWGMGVEYLANRFAPESVKRMAGAVGGYLPKGPGAVVNGWQALGQPGISAMNAVRGRLGMSPIASAQGANVLSRIPGFAGAAGRLGTGGLAGYGVYVAGQAPIDLYNVATGKVNLNERAGTQQNQGLLSNIGQNLAHPGEAIAEMGPVLPYALGRAGYDYLSARSRGSDLDQQLAQVKARMAARAKPVSPNPAI